MRIVIFTALVGLMAATNPDVRDWTKELFVHPVDPREAAAIEVRCAEEHEAFRDDCALELKRDFELGVRQPDTILRMHCTRYASDWAARPPAAREVCREIFGGWIES
jgi:hypothetical protein